MQEAAPASGEERGVGTPDDDEHERTVKGGRAKGELAIVEAGLHRERTWVPVICSVFFGGFKH